MRHGGCFNAGMPGAKHFTELVTWQLADALRVATISLTRRGTYSRNFKLREQTDDAIDSVCRNIAEGFAADTHGQFASYLRIARRSFNELSDALISAEERKLVTPADLADARQLMRRLLSALNRLIAYLEKDPRRRNRPDRRSRDGGFYYEIR
jgi:four helix bundle protein